MSALTWDDLFIEAANLDFDALLQEWPGVIAEQIRPIGASVFGDLFFERKTGEVEKLDVLEGGLHFVAESFQQFSKFMNSQEWQEQNLLSQGVALLHERGVLRDAGQFFGFAPHPALVGEIDWSRVLPLNAKVWNSICAQTLMGVQAAEVPVSPSVATKRAWWKWKKK